MVEKKTAISIAREYFPGLSDAVLSDIAWGMTGFPHFWRIPQDGDTPEACFRKQLSELKESAECDDIIEKMQHPCR